ncbi:endolytic transglycosylase MltG, partial [Patescibacteria group bacterium]|nr:endolytic transglycosylase MltG [Patescibacteria group bacterium]
DLKIDSPYNTYLYKGLPPGPIANPGLMSIESALSPAESKYWYYLSDKEGNIHYSATYDEHLSKKQLYIDN